MDARTKTIMSIGKEWLGDAPRHSRQNSKKEIRSPSAASAVRRTFFCVALPSSCAIACKTAAFSAVVNWADDI